MVDTKKEQEREELHRAIWAIADAPYTVYRPVYLQVKDGAFAALSALCAMGAVLL